MDSRTFLKIYIYPPDFPSVSKIVVFSIIMRSGMTGNAQTALLEHNPIKQSNSSMPILGMNGYCDWFKTNRKGNHLIEPRQEHSYVEIGDSVRCVQCGDYAIVHNAPARYWTLWRRAVIFDDGARKIARVEYELLPPSTTKNVLGTTAHIKIRTFKKQPSKDQIDAAIIMEDL